jgi:multiple sugar transport system substrate-binding protein
MSKPEEKKPEEQKVSRRNYLQIAGGTVVGLVVGGALGYVAKPTVTAPPVTSTVTAPPVTVTATATATSTTTAVPVGAYVPPPGMPYTGVTLNCPTQTGPPIAGPAEVHAPGWGSLTGGRVNIIEIPYADLYSKIMTDLTTGTKSYDMLIAPSWATPDFSPYVVDLTDMDETQLIDWDDVIYQRNTLWAGRRYNVPLDGDNHMLYYNKLALENPDYQAKFKAKYGYDIPAANGYINNITWEEYHDIGEFFNGWDWVGDGRKRAGVLECCARGTQTPWWFWDRTIGYSTIPFASGGAPDEYHGMLYFDPDTMDPLVKNPGFVKGLTNFVDIVECGPPGMLSMSVGDTRAGMCNGDAALAIDWGDIGVMSVDPKTSKIIGKCGFGQVPGANTVYDRQSQAWVDATWSTVMDHTGKPINVVPMLNFGGWAGFVVKTASNVAAAFDFLKYMNSPAISLQDVLGPGDTGFNPYRKSHFTNIAAWVSDGFTEMDAKAYLLGIEKNISDPNAMPDLKIPGSAQYTESIDIHTTEALAKEVSPTDACSKIFDEWQAITDKFGRDKQKAAYHAMMNIP